MYVFVVMVGLWAMYFFLSYCLAAFFEWEKPRFTKQSLYSLGLIALCAVLVAILVEMTENRELANRIQHAFGGGVLAFLTCYLVARDLGCPMTRFQFFVLSVLVVTALGVANEILEFVAQEYFGYVLAKNLNDTWLDLISNSVGALIGAALLVPLYKSKTPQVRSVL